ncbi:GNAT family N-acetyltransferase [Spirosoma utsteinense]|uniref:PhnO protein n=1 Tax=Spirosoma utsteinense TaxID=2585773 RepID=A0ABR6W9U2_9BACT|nr:GNAT family N-acetyltransferase [Spirosoma utsteinense]MBC3786718.1 PhnO protein [Spirosoma utsteinense]MBC3793340.1 PhnO protein [Spirosoma utsteinense]
MTNQSTPLVTIRPAHQTDVDVVYEFLCDLEDTALNRSAFQLIFEGNLANPMVHYLIAEQDGLPVGFLSCHVQYLLHHTGKVGEIQELYVKPDQRKQRIGHQFIAALGELASREGFTHLEVTTNQKRTETIRFYEREHFSCTHFKLVKSL